VPQSLLSHFIDSITIWGRKARWLRIFEVLKRESNIEKEHIKIWFTSEGVWLPERVLH